MNRAIVDASVVLAALFADGRARFALLHTPWALYVPPFVIEECRRHLPRAALHAGIDEDLLEQVFATLLDRLEVIPRPAFASMLGTATVVAEAADAMGDQDYIALALLLDAPIWTYDDDFRRIPSIRTVATFELMSDL